MVELQNKLVLFRNLIWSEMKQKSEQQLYASAEQNSKMIAQRRAALEREARTYVSQHVDRAMFQAREKIAIQKQENQRVFLETQKKCFDALTESIRQKFVDFSTTEEYKDWFRSHLKTAIAEIGDVAIISVLERDREMARAIVVDKIAIETMRPIEIGGFLLVNADHTQRIRKTFRSLMQENEYEIGKKLNEWLKEGVLQEAKALQVSEGAKE